MDAEVCNPVTQRLPSQSLLNRVCADVRIPGGDGVRHEPPRVRPRTTADDSYLGTQLSIGVSADKTQTPPGA